MRNNIGSAIRIHRWLRCYKRQWAGAELGRLRCQPYPWRPDWRSR